MEILYDDLKNVRSMILENIEELLPNNSLVSFLNGKSKMIRSILPLLYFKANNITINNHFYSILTVGELIHNASLLHDDIIDNASERRNSITINKIYNSKIALLCGDYLVSQAIDTILKIDNQEIAHNFNSCTAQMVKAEIKQFLLRNKETTLNDYIEICTGKTASLFSVIMQNCAILSNFNIEIPTKFGNIFGLCFQINNDFLNTSVIEDKKNGISTAKKIIGIENTQHLLDNYKKELLSFTTDMPNNVYKNKLEGLIDSLCQMKKN
ncbi:MAG: polyprenyl synthetase family protein [bacterium]|nr:polyprenyl synthetase family protein [bacterium]